MIPPPVFPDVVHVANGCFVSAVVYISRFTAAFPGERGETAALMLPNDDGQIKPHTLAVVTWHGEWWARDEYYGVFSLSEPVERPWTLGRLRRRAITEMSAAAARARRERRPVRQVRPPTKTLATRAWRREQIDTAQALLPLPAEVCWFDGSSGPEPFLFFRLGGDRFAVYDPSVGTASANSPEHQSGRLVAAVARRMGYRPALA